jgi:hypothetical protein
MSNIAIWSGSSVFTTGSTPFGFYDNDTAFRTEADQVAKWCAQRLGYPLINVELQSGSFDFLDSYKAAETPWIISQTANATNQNLFKFHTIASGINANYEIKAAISNIKPAGTVAGSEYGSFSILIRAVDQTKLASLGSPFTTQDSDMRPNILESFDNVNLDPNSPRFIARVIGDRYKTLTSGKVIINGDYSNKSKYVYVEVDNYYTKILSGWIGPEPINEKDYEIAISSLHKIDVILISEWMNSITQIEVIDILFPSGKRDTNNIHNVVSDRKIRDYYQYLVQNWNDLKEKMVKINNYDIKLYSYALLLTAKRFMKIRNIVFKSTPAFINNKSQCSISVKKHYLGVHQPKGHQGPFKKFKQN